MEWSGRARVRRCTCIWEGVAEERLGFKEVLGVLSARVRARIKASVKG